MSVVVFLLFFLIRDGQAIRNITRLISKTLVWFPISGIPALLIITSKPPKSRTMQPNATRNNTKYCLNIKLGIILSVISSRSNLGYSKRESLSTYDWWAIYWNDRLWSMCSYLRKYLIWERQFCWRGALMSYLNWLQVCLVQSTRELCRTISW